MTRLTSVLHTLMLLLLCACCTLPLFAADTTEALFLQGKAAVTKQQWDRAIEQLEAFRTQAPPTSDALSEATVLLFRAYLGANTPKQAEPLWPEILKRWPASETAWQAAEALYRFRAPSNPAVAKTMLDDLVKQGKLPDGSEARVRALHLTVMEQINPAEFCAFALPIINTARTATDLAGMAEPAQLARRVYLPLMTANRFTEAKAVSALIQEQLALLGDTKGGLQADTVAYIQALCATAPAQAVKELKPLLGMLKMAETLNEAIFPVTVIRDTYAPLIKAGFRTDAQNAHTRVQTRLQELGNLGNWHLTDTQAYCEALAATDTDAFVAEALPIAHTMATAKTVQEVLLGQALARKLYLPLVKAKRVGEAKTLFTAVQTGLEQNHDPNSAKAGHLADYLAALEQAAPDTFVSEALTLMEAVPDVQYLQALGFFEGVAQRLYGPLMKAGRLDDARACHQAIYETRVRLNGRWNTDDLYRYFQQLQAASPERFLTEALATIQPMKDVTTEAEAQRVADMVSRIYPALTKANRVAEVRALHTQVAHALSLWGKNPALVTAETLQYLAILATTDPDHYLAEALPVAQRISTMATPESADLPAQVARLVYLPLLKAKRDTDVVTLHTQVQDALTRVKAPDDARFAEMADYLRALADAGSPQLVTENATVRALLKGAATQPAAMFPLSMAARLYLPLLQQKRTAEVSALRQDVVAALTRVKAPVEQQVAATAAYLLALEQTDPAGFLTAALPIAQTMAQSTNAAEIGLALDLAGRVYKPLIVAKRVGEAKVLHTQVQTAAEHPNANVSTAAALAWSRYLEALGQLPDTDLLAETTVITTRLASVTKPEEMKSLFGLATRQYAPLLKADRGGDATALHQAVLTAIQRTQAGEASRVQALALYYDALIAADPDRFTTEAQAALLATKAVAGPLEAARLQYMAAQIYGQCTKAKRLEDVRTVHAQVQTLLGGPTYIVSRHADTGAYLGALVSLDPAGFQTEVLPALLASLQEATAPEHVALALGFAHRVYEPLMLAKQVEAHQRLHAAIQAKLVALGSTQHAKALADQDDYLALLARINPPVFLTDAQPMVEQALAAKAVDSLPLTPEDMRLVYTGLFTVKRLDEAKALHGRLQTAWSALDGGASLVMDASIAYWRAAAAAMPEYVLTDGLTELLNAEVPTTVAAAQLPVERLRVTYPLLQLNNRSTEAQKLHEKYQPALAKLERGATVAKAEQMAYLMSLVPKQPDAFVSGAQPVLTGLATMTTPEEVSAIKPFVATAYQAYMLLGRMADAKALHTNMQARITVAGNPSGVADADNLAYRDALSKGAIDNIYAMFKRALAAEDIELARKWLNNLNEMAPEDPKAIEARRLFKQLQQGQ